MITTVLLTVALAAPTVAGQPERWELGRLRLDLSSGLTWPGRYLPAFTLVPERRRVHRLTLGLDVRALRGLSFDVAMVEPSSSVPYAWTGARGSNHERVAATRSTNARVCG